MAAKLWNPYPSPMFDANGIIAGGARAFFYFAGTSSPLTIYADSLLAVPAVNPAVAGGNGVFAPVYLPFINYRVLVKTATGGTIFEADGISNPAPPASGGGGGIIVAQEQVYNTGDTKWTLAAGSITGFVRMNLRTIGSAISGATERANADTENLFTYLWNNLPDSEAPVSGGRGASAAADYAANKTIGVPTMKGLTLFGVDDMGGTAAGAIQAITTCSTNNTAVVVAASNSNLAVGMNAIVNEVGGRTIISINGTSITLSSAVAGTASGLSFRASQFTDAQIVGGKIAKFAHIQLTAQMAAHNHTITDGGHSHNVPIARGAGGTVGGVENLANANNTASASAVTGISINNSGGGQPAPVLPSSRLVIWHMKL